MAYINDTQLGALVTLITGKLNELNLAAAAAFRGGLAIADTPTGNGFWLPTESGTYTNAGSIVVDLTAGLTVLAYDGTTWTDVVVPIDLSGYELKSGVLDYLKDFVTVNPNLYKEEDVVFERYINVTTGAITAGLTNPIITDFIEVDPTKNYKISSDISLGLTNFRTVGFYNSSFSPVARSYYSGGTHVNVNCTLVYADNGWYITDMPVDTMYIVFSLRGNDTTTTWSTANILMQEGDVIKPIYETDLVTLPILEERVENFVEAEIITPEITYVEGSLFNASGGTIGNIIASATWLRTGLLPVIEGEQRFVTGVIGAGNFYIMFYNDAAPSNATYVSQIRPNYPPDPARIYSFIIPAGVTHVGFNIGNTSVYTFAQLKEFFKFSSTPTFSEDKKLEGFAVNKNSILTPLSLTWNSGGDSITWQDKKLYTTGPDTGTYAIGYQTLVRNKVNFFHHNNYGVSGDALSASNPDDGKCWVRDSATWAVADVFTLAHGTNDFRLNRPLGTTSDYINATGDLTFYGALREFIDYCYGANSEYKIILITPIQRNNFYDTFDPNALGHTLNDYADAIRFVGERESLSVVDLLRYGGINLHNLSTYTIDGLHPNNLGYEVMAAQIIAEMEKFL